VGGFITNDRIDLLLKQGNMEEVPNSLSHQIRYSGQNGLLHYSSTIASHKVPRNIRKQLQDAPKQRQRQ
jgi:hypothetical protein